ncbi:MAG: hypothetical protein PHD83_01475 [Caldisericia bacterium]|nr:hypothetical protein [Caldisericia bacterium]
MKTLTKKLFILVFLFGMLFNCFFNQQASNAVVNCEDIIFEPMNAIELQGYTDVIVPYMSGLASQAYNQAQFSNIDIYRLESNSTKTLITYKIVNKTTQLLHLNITC